MGYAAAEAKLLSPLEGGDGWEKAGDTRSTASELSAYAEWNLWGWADYLQFNIAATDSLNPFADLHDSEAENLLSGLKVELGKQTGWALAFDRIRVLAEGRVTESGKLAQDGTFLEPGDRFDMGTDVDSLVLLRRFRFDSLFMKDAHAGVGVARIRTIGIRGTSPLPDGGFEFGEVEEEATNYGPMLRAGFGSRGLEAPKVSWFFWQFDFDAVFADNPDGALLFAREGTAFGFDHVLGEQNWLSWYISVPVWQLASPEEGFDSAQSTNAFILGFDLHVGI
jgi:hypothetical protein